MTAATTATTLSGLLPLIGVVIGLAGGLASTIVVDWRREQRQSKSLARAFQGELRALIHIVRERRYVEVMQQAAAEVRAGSALRTDIPIRREYFHVYLKNVDKIGTLRSPLPEKIVTVYTLATAVLEDLDTHRDPAVKAAAAQVAASYEGVARLLTEAITLAETICRMIDTEY